MTKAPDAVTKTPEKDTLTRVPFSITDQIPEDVKSSPLNYSQPYARPAERPFQTEAKLCYSLGMTLAAGGTYGYWVSRSIPSLFFGVALGVTYMWSGHLMNTNRELNGTDLSLLSSLALFTAMGPRAYRTGFMVPYIIAGAGAMGSFRLGYLSYKLHSGLTPRQVKKIL